MRIKMTNHKINHSYTKNSQLPARENHLLFGILAAAAGLFLIFMCIFVGKKSYGLEGDELFCYISSTSMGGWKGICFLDDQTWYDGGYFYQATVATGEERFNIPMVFENQAMDTHPPLYYVFLNLVCSFFPGQFSKWFGIGINIVFLLLTGIGLFLLLEHFLHKKYVSLCLSTIFCCSYLSINMTLFIRMYILLMVCFLFSSWYHLQFYQRVAEEPDLTLKKEWKQYLILAALTLVGALTHYYFLVYQAMIAALYIIVLWKKKKIRQIIDYVITMALSGILYCLMYPAVFTHIFFKYEGRDAVHKFLKTTSLFGEGIEMLKSFNSSMFKGFFFPLLGIMTAATLVLVLLKKFPLKTFFVYLFFLVPSIVYFWGISKASPFITIRYVSPVAAFIYTFIILWLKLLLDSVRKWKFSYLLICILMGAITVFLPVRSVKEPYFAERTAVIEDLASQCDHCAYVTGDSYNWKMWEDYVIYPEFEALFFIDGVSQTPITDEQFLQQEDLVVFVDKALDFDAVCDYLQDALKGLTYEIKYETPYVSILYFS